jgi:uncharacterized membrane protein
MGVISVVAMTSMFLPTALLVALSIPLALKLVPPNRIYGYRTAQTLASTEGWFRINRVAGLSLIAAAAMALSIYRYRPELASGPSVAGVLVLVLPVLFALAVTAIYARKYPNSTH